MPEEALASFTVSDAYRQFTGLAQLLRSDSRLVLDILGVTYSRSRLEYLVPTNNIIALDSYFILPNKSNLSSRI